MKLYQPTRMEMNRLKAKRQTAARGHKLLKDKRDELMRQFLELVRQTAVLRQQTESRLYKIQGDFLWAGTELSENAFRLALASVKKAQVEEKTENRMGVSVPVFSLTELPQAAVSLAFSPGSLVQAAAEMQSLAKDLLQLAGQEESCRRMAVEIEKTRRRVGALERVVLPETEEGIRYIRLKLEENERNSQIRLRKVQERMVQGNG